MHERYLTSVSAPHVNVYAAEEAVAVDDNFWCVHGKVIRVDGAVLDLEVMPAKKTKATNADAEALWDVDIGTTENSYRIDGGRTVTKGYAGQVDVNTAESSNSCQGTGYCPAIDRGATEDAQC